MLLYEVAKFSIWHLEKNKSKICKFGLVINVELELILCPTFLILTVGHNIDKQKVRMNLEKFKIWLDEENGSDFRTIQSRISNCRTVENYEGDLDEHYEKDKGLFLLERLSYSTEDQRNQSEPKHKIPITGNLRTGSATLKQAVKLYITYRNSNFEPVSYTHLTLPTIYSV